MDMEVLDLKAVKGERHIKGFFEREVRYLGSHVLFAAGVVSFIVMRDAFMSWVSSTLPLWTKCNRYIHVVFGNVVILYMVFCHKVIMGDNCVGEGTGDERQSFYCDSFFYTTYIGRHTSVPRLAHTF